MAVAGVILRPDASRRGGLDPGYRKAKSICAENPAPATNIIAAGLARVDVDNQTLSRSRRRLRRLPRGACRTFCIDQLFVRCRFTLSDGGIARNGVRYGEGVRCGSNRRSRQRTGTGGEYFGGFDYDGIRMIVGIPAMFFFFFFKNKYGKITSRVARVVGDLEFTLTSSIKRR